MRGLYYPHPLAQCAAIHEERDRHRKALEHIVESAEHPSPTVNTAAYLAQVARDALSRTQHTED